VQLEIRYRTDYRYEPPISGGLSVLRLRPRSRPGLDVISATVKAQPGGVCRSYLDAWGTMVDVAETDGIHDSAHFEMHAIVRTNAVEEADSPPDPWELYASRSPSRRTPLDAVTPLGWDLGDEGRTWLSVDSLLRWFPQRFQYRVGTTDATTPIAKVIEQGSGVCQDFAHVMLAMLRRWGWPARYVSGYFFSATRSSLHIEAEAMHAWVEAYRAGAGWIGLDATTGDYTDDRYVPVSYGRDYDDVTPVRGVLMGVSEQAASATLEIQQIAPAAQQQ
jgi:transglutaminase-like putative cysteine protease